MRHFVSRIVGAFAAAGGAALLTEAATGMLVLVCGLLYGLVHRGAEVIVDPKDHASDAR